MGTQTATREETSSAEREAFWRMVKGVNRARRNRGPKLIERCYTHLYGTRHPDYVRRADSYSISSGADQAGARMRFREARENGRTIAQQVMHDIAAGTENYMLCVTP